MRASATRYWRQAKLPACRFSWALTLRKPLRSSGVSAGAGAGAAAAAGAAGLSSRFRSSASKRALAVSCGVAPLRISVPSLLKALVLSWPLRFQLERCADAVALPRTPSASGGIFASSTLACRSSASKLSDARAGLSVRSLRKVPAILRCGAWLVSWASKPGRRIASKFPLGGRLENRASSGNSPPRDSLPLKALPPSWLPVTASSGQSRSSESGWPPCVALTRA